VPGDWLVIIADVKNSTAAVNAGRHNDVNLVAASCLVVALNVANKAGIDIPFFFTGDGGTVLVPPAILDEVLAGLHTHNSNSSLNFNLQLHIGCVAVSSIQEAGFSIKIAKSQVASMTKAVIIGDGLQYAEQQVKQSLPAETSNADAPLLDMEGLECRWDKIKPPSEQMEVVCYLVAATAEVEQARVYGDVLHKMDEIYGAIENRNPISIDRLKLLLSVNKVKKEMMAKFGRWKRNYIASTLLKTFIGRLYFKFNWKINKQRGREYLEQVISNADILTIDGRINCILSATADKRIRFVEYLSQQEQSGRLVFGHFVSRESVMTCYIESRNQRHIHFVDGADGGYTEASKELKQKLAALTGHTS
jgi:hypothetical protein